MSFFSKLISNKTINGKLELTEVERDVLLDLVETGVVTLRNNEVKLEKNMSLITKFETTNNVYFCEIRPFMDCYLYVFTAEKPVLLTRYNYTKKNKYQNKLDEINAKVFDKNKFVVLMDIAITPENKQKLFTIKKVLATKSKNYLLEHSLDIDKMFQTQVPYK